MNVSNPITRRTAFGMALAASAIPVLAGKETFIRILPAANPSVVVLTTFSGSLTATFESDLVIGSAGRAWGYLRFPSGLSGSADLVAERGGLEFNASGEPIRAEVLLRTRGASGRPVFDYALTTIDLPCITCGRDCLIYTTTGTQVHADPIRFETPGGWLEWRFPRGR